MQPARPSTAVATASFVALALCVVGVASRDLRPWPLYASATSADWLAVTRSRDIVFEWGAPTAPSGLLMRVVSRGTAPLRVRLLGAVGRELAAWTVDERPESDAAVRLPVAPTARGPGRWRLELSSNADDDARAPRVAWVSQRLAGRVEVGGKVQEGEGPLVVLEYPWPSLALLWLWLLVPLSVAVDGARGRGAVVLPVALGLAALATSTLLWQRDYVRSLAHWDADEFGAYATWLATWIAIPARRAAAEAWFREYTHAHNPLGPALMAIPIALGAPAHLVYVVFSALCGFAALLVVRRILTRTLGVSPPVVVAALALYGCHLLFVRSFARPVTDALGHLLTVGTLALVLDRWREPARPRRAGLSALSLLNAVARPQGLAYLPFVTGAAIADDARRARDRLLPDVVRDLLWLAVVPLAFVLGLFAAFGWWRNASALLAARGRYGAWVDASHFAWSFGGTIQLLPLLWAGAGRRLRGAPALLLAWLVYYLGVLVAVRAPFWMRHFLPVLPAAVLLAAIGLDGTRGRTRLAAFALVALVCLANVAALVHLILDPASLSLRLFGVVALG